jgi:hypothetical protein
MGTCINAPGVYDVRFEYVPRFWRLSLTLAFCGIVTLFGIVGWAVRRKLSGPAAGVETDHRFLGAGSK